MKEIELDSWFFNLPACQQMDITGIHINENTATDATYEKFDLAVTNWWDGLDYENKMFIYNTENL